jgi:ribulose-bisphosphate carboxylase large chain
MNLQQGVFFDQDWAGLRKIMPVASGGIHAGQMHQLITYLGEDSCCSSAAARSATRKASKPAPRRTASHSNDPSAQRGSRLERRAADPRRGREMVCSPLHAALQTWKDVTFDYTSTDTADFVPTATAS